MLAEYIEAGGPVMYAVLATWVVVLAGVLDRLGYAIGRTWRQPLREVQPLAATGERSRRREFFRFEREKTGSVDGAAMDIEGAYWTVLYGGGRLIRILPDGTVEREIPLPVTQPTMPAFAGPEMKTIVITSASQNLSEQELEAQPLAGGLLAVAVDVPGHQVYPFGG